jgi:type II secretory pathway pseudopilin PulG
MSKQIVDRIRNRREQRGMTLAETLVALGIVSGIIIMSSRMLTTAYRGTQDNINKQFATQKAVSMLEELRSLIQSQSATNAVVLDQFDDGVVNQPLLTTQAVITDPGDPASGNSRAGGRWLFERRVSVQKLPGANDLRLVNVKVFINESSGQRLLAEVASVLSTVGQNSPPTQVYDIYLVAIENIPGWWVHMQNVVPFVESAMQDLESRQPGLQFRRHWIRKLSYGRDPYYTPYVNSAADSNATIDSVYFYPGRMPSGSAVDFYYPPDFFSGRVKVDSAIVNGFDATTNPMPYSLADQFNNGMRYADELRLFNDRVAAGTESADVPTLRLLLDDMYMHPSRYKNAILINLHGELFPFPPVRNYSDAAKDPAAYPNVRAVTHPQQLRYTNSDPLALRVYSYHTNLASPASVPDWLGRGTSATPITVTLKNIRYSPGPNDVAAIPGGVDFDGNGSPDNYSGPVVAPQTPGSGMYWSWAVNGSDTVFSLYNSPLKSPCVTVTTPCDRGGISGGARLYGLEYVPSPVEDLPTGASPNAFTTTLASNGDTAKNTARWIINVPASALPPNAMVTIETRIGADLTSGTLYPVANAPSNVSRTYAWRGTDAWIYGDATTDPNLPITERFQLLGDPRHCPYADLKSPHAGSGRSRANALGMGYNRYFDDFHAGTTNASTTWQGWAYDAPPLSGNWYGVKNNTADNNPDNDGWQTSGGMVEIDMPRIFQIVRSAITRPHAVYTTMTGFSYYYVGIGNEIGYDDSNGFPNSISTSAKPFTGATTARNEQSITNALTGGVKYIRENAAGSYWWSMSWLGELAPDSQWNSWQTTGNLPTGTTAGTFSRVLRGSITPNLPPGTSFFNSVRRTNEQGSTTFFWSGSANSTFHHRYADGTDGTLDTDGTAIANTYALPLADTISNNRPFDINVNDTGMNPDHFLQPVYGSASTLQTLARFYRHSTNIQGSSLLGMRSGADAAFVVVNGLSPTGTSGVAFISRWSFLSLVQSFMAGGLYSSAGVPDPSRVRELPRVAITTPNDDVDLRDPSSIPIAWTSQWKRWDGLPYTPAYPANFADDSTVRFATLYSRDNGRTWLHMQDDTSAQPGVRPVLPAHLITATSYSWSTPAAAFPKGNYVIRIEAYRDEVPLHYAFHQYRAFIKR